MTIHISWRDDAACRDADPDLFFPIGTTGPALRHIDEAKRICRVCPAQIQCLDWALDHGVTDGVWGGATADERRALRSQLRKMTINVARKAMATVITEQSMENMEYVRRLLKQKQPGFSATLESATDLVGRELGSPEMLRDISATKPRSTG
jgi:WhiB family redox-sensing transcriptional regulator